MSEPTEPRSPKTEERSPALLAACDRPLPALARHGLDLFDRGEYFEAHEELELAWRAEPGPVRDLYQGILQIGIAYLHVQRGNYRGARKMFLRARASLASLPDRCQGIDLRRFQRDYEQAEAAVVRLGPDRLNQFDPHLFQPVPRVDEHHGGEHDR
ncbi:MAG TPA: DUF309 domain-containing protein [Anaerolineaceae bacterium]|nr:DUF309 domain-containing protein [Anaerolineaceae bacterium]